MSLDTATKNAIIAEYGGKDRRHRQPRGPGRAADAAHQRPDRAPEDAQARPPQPARAAAAGRPAPPSAAVPGEDRHQPLPVAHRAARAAPLAIRRERTRRSRRSRAGSRWTGCAAATTEHPDPQSGHRALALQTLGRRSSVVAPGPGGPPRGSRSHLRPRVASIEDRLLRGRHRCRTPASARRPAWTDRRRRATLWRVRRSTPPTPSSTTARFGTRTIRFETGRLARQAAGSAVAYLDDDTMVLSATTASQAPEGAPRLLPADGRRRGAHVRRRADPRLVLPPRGPSQRGRDPDLPADRPAAAAVASSRACATRSRSS